METKESTIFRLTEIIARSMQHPLSPEEEDILEKWLEQNPDHRAQYTSFGTEEFFLEKTKQRQTVDWQSDCRRFLLKQKYRRKQVFWRRFSRYAAVFVFLVSGFSMWSVYLRESENLQKNEEIPFVHKKAFLTLAEGRQIVLSDTSEAQIVPPQRGARIEIKKNEITYSGLTATNDSVPYNILQTNRGGEYRLTLSDGSRVWLNAESRLCYPVKFTGNRRTVYLSGEAYFEVQSDTACPFIVISGPAEVRVLGTSFNLRAYPEEDIVTTLVAGAVQMSEKISGKSVRLSPGEQGAFETANGRITKREVDTYPYTAWKDGRIVFRNMRLEDLFTILARWYDLQIFYVNPEVKDIRFTGDMDKMEHFEEILYVIEQNRRVCFSVKHHTVSIALQK